jgi:kumamolisin
MPQGASNLVTIPGTFKPVRSSAVGVGDVDPLKIIQVTVVLRPPPDGEREVRQLLAQYHAVTDRRPLAPLASEDFGRLRDAAPNDVEEVVTYARTSGLTVAAIQTDRRTVELTGPAGLFFKAFGVRLQRFRVGGSVYRGYTGSLFAPVGLVARIRAILGFDTRPLFETRTPDRRVSRSPQGTPGYTATGYTPPEVARMYGLPALTRGAGECIAIIEMNDPDEDGAAIGGGYSPTELATYFAGLGVSPSVTAIGVAGGANLPGISAGTDDEVTLDIEIAGSIASRAHIAVYFAPNTDPGWLAALGAAIHDRERKPSVLSISWAGDERDTIWLPSVKDATNDLFVDATLRSITICVASGDYGSSGDLPLETPPGPHVFFPGSNPYALACGGTKITTKDGMIMSEVVWKSYGQASGGGVSIYYDLPTYQASAGVPLAPDGSTGRGVPDVAGDADYDSGYQVRWVDGTTGVAGGTSCVAPLYAAIIAVTNGYRRTKGFPPLGFVHPLLYSRAGVRLFFDVVSGDNDLDGLGVYSAHKGWDACTGLGAPRLQKMMGILGGI